MIIQEHMNEYPSKHSIKVRYDQAHNKVVSHTCIKQSGNPKSKYLKKSNKQKAKHSLSKPNDLYKFSPFGNKYQKDRISIELNVALALIFDSSW
jgi:hypothetical protein